MNAIEINSLTKNFKNSTAVDNISLSVEEGEIFGFLGPNGAGKSTTMMILTTLLKPTSGNASVYGFDVVSNASQVRKNIGFVQQEIGIDEYLTARENLQFQCKISRIPSEQIEKRIEERPQQSERTVMVFGIYLDKKLELLSIIIFYLTG